MAGLDCMVWMAWVELACVKWMHGLDWMGLGWMNWMDGLDCVKKDAWI